MEIEAKNQEGSLISAAEWQATSMRFNGLSPIDYLFEKFANLYMSKWSSQFPSNKELKSWKTAWAEELADEKITFQEVKNGLDYCKKHYRDWPPTFPQFLEACRPSLDYESAFHEAVSQMQLRENGRDSWSNPAIYWAAVELGSDIMGANYQIVKGRWKAALDKAIECVRTGQRDTVIPKRTKHSGYLEAPKREYGNYTGASLNGFASAKEILNKIPAWKMKKNNPGEQEGATA